MTDDIVPVTVEVCSGPLDGTGIQVSDGSFSVGYGAGCDLPLPKAIGLPERAYIHVAVESGRGLVLEAECDVEYAGTRTSTVRGRDGLILRVGATDLAVSVAGPDEGQGTVVSSSEAPDDRKKCATCGWENASGARWCSNCGRDL